MVVPLSGEQSTAIFSLQPAGRLQTTFSSCPYRQVATVSRFQVSPQSTRHDPWPAIVVLLHLQGCWTAGRDVC